MLPSADEICYNLVYSVVYIPVFLSKKILGEFFFTVDSINFLSLLVISPDIFFSGIYCHRSG